MAICIYCKHDGAYISAWDVECPSTTCSKYSTQQAEIWRERQQRIAERLTRQLNQTSAQETLDSDSTPDHNPVYLWCNRFNDFGD